MAKGGNTKATKNAKESTTTPQAETCAVQACAPQACGLERSMSCAPQACVVEACVVEACGLERSVSCAPQACAPQFSESTCEATTTTGCVKWFNNKAGYGFITVNDVGKNEPTDIFVHHTAIQVSQSQYKYLVQGEYVELTISPVDNDKHEVQVSDVRGIKGGKLMCETRNEIRSSREEHHQPPPAPKTQRKTFAPSRDTNRPPQLSKSDELEWMIVPRRKTATTTTTVQKTPPTPTKRSKPQQRQPTVELNQ